MDDGRGQWFIAVRSYRVTADEVSGGGSRFFREMGERWEGRKAEWLEREA